MRRAAPAACAAALLTGVSACATAPDDGESTAAVTPSDDPGRSAAPGVAAGPDGEIRYDDLGDRHGLARHGRASPVTGRYRRAAPDAEASPTAASWRLSARSWALASRSAAAARAA